MITATVNIGERKHLTLSRQTPFTTWAEFTDADSKPDGSAMTQQNLAQMEVAAMLLTGLLMPPFGSADTRWTSS